MSFCSSRDSTTFINMTHILLKVVLLFNVSSHGQSLTSKAGPECQVLLVVLWHQRQVNCVTWLRRLASSAIAVSVFGLLVSGRPSWWSMGCQFCENSFEREESFMPIRVALNRPSWLHQIRNASFKLWDLGWLDTETKYPGMITVLVECFWTRSS